MVDQTSILIHFLHTKTTGSERYTGLPKVTEISGRVACENRPLAPRCCRLHDFLLIGWW